MSVKLRTHLYQIVSSPAPAMPAPLARREKSIVAAGVAIVMAWVFAGKMRAFLGLETTSDLYQFTQLATSWLHGEFLHDNCYGNHLSIHTYFFCPVLGLLAYPLGAVGLLLALAIAAGLGVVAAMQALRWLSVPTYPAFGFAIAITAMPLAQHVYEDATYGFHVDLLVPAMVLWLAYFLLRRNWPGALALAVVTLSVKEDSPLIVAAVAAIVVLEDLVRGHADSEATRHPSPWNLPALVVAAGSVLAVPLLLHILKSQAIDGYSPGSFQRLHPTDATTIGSSNSLLKYVWSHLGGWLGSPTVAKWLGVSLAATFGLILVRPHFLIAGVVTTLIAWLMQDELLWASRFAHALAFFQVAACVGFASVYRLGRTLRQSAHSRLAGAACYGVAGIVVIAACWRQSAVIAATRVPVPQMSSEDRAKADRLFARYRREARPEEPVIASGFLFRYAHDRNLFWHDRLAGYPKPTWILWDEKAKPLDVLWTDLWTGAQSDPQDYDLVERADRFLLFKRKPASSAPRSEKWNTADIPGDSHGSVRMMVRFPISHAGVSEPLLSLGATGRGDVFFVRYVGNRELRLGMESIGAVIHVTEPIKFDPERAYALELFSGSMLPPDSADDEDHADERGRRLFFQQVVSIRLDGTEVLRTFATPHTVGPRDVAVGRNTVGAGSALTEFGGQIWGLQRGGYPAGATATDYGAVRLLVQLPAATAGIPEPLVTAGPAGFAALGYVRVLPDARIKVGMEFWGVGAYESESVPIDRGLPVEIIFACPTFYPASGESRWGDVPRAEQELVRHRVKVSVNGTVVLEHSVNAPRLQSLPVSFGRNLIGGSLVSGAFTGVIVQVSRVPLINR